MRLKSSIGVFVALILSVGVVLSARPLPQAAAAQAPAKTPPPLAAAADQQFTADGVTLRYRDAGTGTPIVYIHGYSAALESMIAISNALGPSYRAIALDVRGFGKSSKFGDPSRFGQQMVDDVTRLMDHLKIQRAHVVGHSMGALIAANVATRYPARVITASLVAGPFYADEATFTKETGRWTTDLEGGAGLVNFMQWLFPAMKPEMAGMVNAGAMKTNDLPSLIAVMRSLPKLSVSSLKAGSKTALLVAGTNDPLHPLSVTLSKQSPGSRLVEVQGADHVGVITNAAAVTAMKELVQAH